MIVFLLFYFLFNFKMSQHGTVTWASRGFSFAGWGLVGSPGWFRNSGEFAIQMIIFGSLAISFVYSLKEYWGRYKKWFFYIVAATGYMAVMGASSRGSQLALLVIGIWWLMKLRGGYKAVLIIALLASALFFILPEEQILRFKEMGQDQSSLQRFAYWEWGLDVIKEHPLIGIGYNNWLPYLAFKVPQGLGPQGLIQVSHNIYIQIAAESGLFALFIFIILVMLVFIMNARTRSMANQLDNKLLYFLAYGLDAGTIGYLVSGFFVTVFYYPFFWIQLSMVVMLYNITNRQFVECDTVEKGRNIHKKIRVKSMRVN
jgi:O-antigen ligase